MAILHCISFPLSLLVFRDLTESLTENLHLPSCKLFALEHNLYVYIEIEEVLDYLLRISLSSVSRTSLYLNIVLIDVTRQLA